MTDGASPNLTPMSAAMIRTFTAWVALLGQLSEAEHLAVVRTAIRMLAAQLPEDEAGAILRNAG